MAEPAANAPLIVVINAASGNRDAELAQSEFAAIWDAAGRPYEFFAADAKRDMQATTRAAVARARALRGVIVAAGGDGTVNTVAHAMRGSGLAFGIIPLGTFNYVARAHGIPLEPAAAARALLEARSIAVQTAQVNGRTFLVNASLGLYPVLLEDREAFKKVHGRSRFTAFCSGCMTLLRESRQWRLRIEAEQGPRLLRTPTLFVGNNAMQLARLGIPEAEAVARGEGVLAAIVVRPIGTLAMFGLALRGALGTLGDADQVESFAFCRLVAEPLGYRRIKVAIDGEVMRMVPPLVFEAGAPMPLLVPAGGEGA